MMDSLCRKRKLAAWFTPCEDKQRQFQLGCQPLTMVSFTIIGYGLRLNFQSADTLLVPDWLTAISPLVSVLHAWSLAICTI